MFESFNLRTIKLKPYGGVVPVGWLFGQGHSPVEIVYYTAERTPTKTTMGNLWNQWVKGRAIPCLFVIEHGEKATLYGHTNQTRDIFPDISPETAESICLAALDSPNSHDAERFLRNFALPGIQRKIPGLRNEYLLAWYTLENVVRDRSDWETANSKGAKVRGLRDWELLTGLGYEIRDAGDRKRFLYAHSKKVAVALLLDPAESFDQPGEYSLFSPVAHGLRVASDERLPYVILIDGPTIRLYATDETVGVGRRGRTETFLEFHLDLLPPDQAGYLWLLLSGDALVPKGTFEQIYHDSTRFAVDLGERLRARVYLDVVPNLAKAVAEQMTAGSRSKIDPKHLYSVTLTIIFRLLLIAYAEDKDLLPATSGLYKSKSLKAKAKEILELVEGKQDFDTLDVHWNDINTVFKAVDKGNIEWGIPSYNGGLFSSDADISREGADIANLSLPNNVFGPILRYLLIDETDDDLLGPVDFRTLSIRDFGTIYEGLLESELAIAREDLAVDSTNKGDLYRPTKKNEEIAISKGEFYLHDKSGARKETGSYYTPQFAVEHLLKYSLDPALDEHLARLNKMDYADAENAFFDFKVADIAMGSGHFLVAAVDRIEQKFMDYLAKKELEEREFPGVAEEFARLRASSKKAFEKVQLDPPDIENGQLLRRQIARRCIYGVDINPMAVKLAQVSLWIHTFVPGLPLAFLDHNLVCGNSLVGIGALDEIEELGSGHVLFMRKELEAALKPLEKLAKLSDADAAEIRLARDEHNAARRAVETTSQKFTMLTATRLDEDCGEYLGNPDNLNPKSPVFTPWLKKAKKAFADIMPFHFPIAFPEVFKRDNPGFDVIIGNPPWEKARVEEHGFWARHFPGFKSLSQREAGKLKKQYEKQRPDLIAELTRETAIAESIRHALITGPFPGMGTGDPDLYKAFCWRFWYLLREGGRTGVVLPRSAFQAKGSKTFREKLFKSGMIEDLTFLLNTGGWVFSDAEHRYTIVLASFCRLQTDGDRIIPIRGPYRSLKRFGPVQRKEAEPVRFPVDEVMTWTDDASLPLLPAEESSDVFKQLRKSPRLDLPMDLNKPEQWRARPYSELHATNDKKRMDFSERCPEGYWPVYKGESFDIWEPDRGESHYYAWVDPDELVEYLQSKRVRARNNSKSPFSEFTAARVNLDDPDNLPCFAPRIAFRDITNRTNTRTVIAVLIPPRVTVNHLAPFLLWPVGNSKDEAYLLAVLSSLSLDWYARRFVELHLLFSVLNPFPIPRPSCDNPLWKQTVALSGRLASPDERFAEWAGEVGVEWGPLPEDEKLDMIHELDAVVAHLYGLTEKHLVHIFETFHEGWDYHARLEATLRHYNKRQR